MTKICYDKDLLQEVCDRDKCIIDFDKIEKYNRDTRVNFICNCGNEYVKKYHQIYNFSGAYCKSCTQTKQVEKSKETFMKKYGVDNPLKNDLIKSKIKQTCLDKYGVEHNSQSVDIKIKK